MAANAKRAYKLQEFVAHSSNVNCLKIGRKTSRVLVTGGEDHKVNVWAIGKPNPVLSLSGHTSAIESVSFDSSEVLVSAGAASGTIKLWDFQEEKVVRTLTGHRSNCISVDFHPFGEFFASGSLDTNLKIWDIRKKVCIHTYKGHTRGVNSIRFTPDGRWVVSGGEDSIVKLWDLTAGKLLHDFKLHEGQIQCMDFHPNEFLLATGSADKTVKFWDLETFELIGSAGPETSGVRSMTFNPDGRTFLCGLHESLKVFSWEPIRCHDTADVGWSRLSDMNIHEGKLLGCSYNQSCVGVWVVDLSRIEPYAKASAARLNGHSKIRSTSSGNLCGQTDNSIIPNMRRLSVSQNSEAATKETKPSSSRSVSTTQRTGTSKSPQKSLPSSAASGTPTLKRSLIKTQPTNNQSFNKSDIIPVIVPRTDSKVEPLSDSRKETNSGRPRYSVHSKPSDFQKLSVQDNSDKEDTVMQSAYMSNTNTGSNEYLAASGISSGISVNQKVITGEKNNLDEIRRVRSARFGANMFTVPSTNHAQENFDVRIHKPREPYCLDFPRGRTRTPISSRESKEPSFYDRSTSVDSLETVPAISNSYSMRRVAQATESENVSATDEDAIADLMELHEEFLSSSNSRLTKLQVIHRLWERNDVKGVISAMEKMSDHAVSADVVNLLVDKSDVVTLDICTCLLPLLTNLLSSKIDRHLTISLDMLLKLVKVFGPTIHSAVSAPSSVGVDLEQEQRIERCNSCFVELQKVKHSIPSLTRRGGTVMKSAQELNLALQEVCS